MAHVDMSVDAALLVNAIVDSVKREVPGGDSIYASLPHIMAAFPPPKLETPAPKPEEIKEKVTMPVNKNFIEARAKLHDARRAEAILAHKLVVEFLKLRRGDVTGKEVEDLFHEWGMPFGMRAESWSALRMELGFPPKKPQILKKVNRKDRAKELRAQFKELVDTTPENERPKVVEPIMMLRSVEAVRELVRADPTPAPSLVPALTASVEATRPNLRNVSTEDLMAELVRRRDEARKVLQSIADWPTSEE